MSRPIIGKVVPAPGTGRVPHPNMDFMTATGAGIAALRERAVTAETELAEASKQLDEAIGLVRELLDDSMPVQYGQRRRRALEYIERYDQENKDKP